MGAVKPLRLFLLALFLGAASYGALRVWDSSLLELKKVEVSGNQQVAKEEVVSAAALTSGVHLFDIATGDVAEKVESLPWIAQAEIERILPSTVRIVVTERSPEAVVIVLGKSWVVDGSGVVLGEGADAPLTILDLRVEDVAAGEKIESPAFGHAVRVYRSLPDDVAARVSAVKAATVDRISLVLADGVVVLFGGAEFLDEKNFAVKALLRRAEKEGRPLTYIDVRVPSRPATRP